MAITKYVATATAVESAGGGQATGFVVYDGTHAYIIPQTATINVAPDTGITTITPAAPTDIVEVEPDTVKVNNIQPSKTVSELAVNTGAITPDGDYDGIASITISSVKLQTPAAFTPVQASTAGISPIAKTDNTAWGLTGVTVNNVLVQTKAATLAEGASSPSVTPDSGYLLSSVTVPGISVYTPEAVTPGASAQTIKQDGSYMKQVTVNAVPIDEAFDSNFTPTTAEQVRSVAANKYFNGTVTVAGAKLQDAGTINPTEAVQNSTDVAPLTGGNIGYSAFAIGAIQTETKTVKSNTTGDQTVDATSGKYIKQITVQPLNAQAKTVDNLTTTTGAITPDGGYDVLASVTVNSVKLDTPEVFTPEEATGVSATSAVVGEAKVGEARVGDEGSAQDEYSTIRKTSADAWGITEAKVEKITVEEKTVKSNLTEDQEVPATAGSYIKNVVVQKLTSQEKTVDPAETSTPVTPDEGVDVLTKVTVNAITVDSANTILPKKGEDVTQNANGYFKSVIVKGYTVNLQDKTVTPEEAEEEVTADSTYDGLGTVTVEAIPTESKTITATKEEQVVSPTPGKYLKSVTVNGYTLNLHEVEVDELTVGQEIVPEPQYDGISKVTINGVKLQDKSVDGSKSQQQVTKDDETAWGLGTVTVGGYTPNLETKTIDELTTETGAIVPGEGYDGIGSLTVSAVKLQNVSVDPTAEGTTAQKTDSTAWGLGTVTVNAPQLDEAITVDPTESVQVKTPTGIGYKGFTVNAIQVDSTNNSATPTLEQQVKNPTAGQYFKQFTVEATPMSDALDITPSETKQDFVPSGTLGYKGATVQAIKVATNNSATPTLEQQVISPDGGGYFKQFTVEATPLAEAQTFTPNDETQTAVLGEGNIGIKGATVNAVPVDSTTNTYTPTAEGATVNATKGQYYKSFVIAPVPTEQRTVAPADEEQVLVPTEGKFFDKVTVTADIDAPLQTKTVTPTATQQVVTPDEGYGGLSSVTVAGAPLDEAIIVQSGTADVEHTPTGLGYKGVTVTGDADLVAQNIKEGIEILGVTGTYSGEEAGTSEVGYEVDEWVALDLPESVTSCEGFRAAPYYGDGHYLGKTFDGGNYMAISVYNKYGKVIASVMLNDVIGKLYLEKVEVTDPFPTVEGVLNLSESVDSEDVDWTQIQEVHGNGNGLTVTQPLTIGSKLKIDSLAISSADSVDLFTTDVLQAEVELQDCSLNGVKITTPTGGILKMTNCSVEDSVSKNSDEEFLLTLNETSVIDRTLIRGARGIKVTGGTVTLSANTLNTAETAIEVTEAPTQLKLEGNIFNTIAGDEVKILDSVTDMSGAYVIGSFNIEGNYRIEGTTIIPTEGTEKPGTSATDKAVSFFNELSQDAITDYMIANRQAVMTALGVTEDSSVSDIGTLLYDKLQGGDTVTINMNDGGALNISGHFYEPVDDLPYWDMNILYSVPKNGTNKCFPEGSKMFVEGGSVLIHITNGEMTSYGDYNMVLLVYGYEVSINSVTVEDAEGSFTLNISGLTRTADFSNPCIIDPDSSTWDIYVRSFYLPKEDAPGTISVDNEAVSWSDIVSKINL